MPGIVEQIRAWAAQLDYWERMALAMLISGRELIEADYQLLLDYFMQDAGLVQMPARPTIELSRAYTGESKTTCHLERIFNLRNVNALAAGQELHFGSQLTLVYGNNGVGKTGYTRPIACAAFARGDREVIPNATIPPNSKLIPQADIEVLKEGKRKVITWTRGQRCDELQGFYVFDSSSLSVHLTRSNPLTISPAGLSLLTRLAEVTDEVRIRLKSLLDHRDVTMDFGSIFAGASTVASLTQNVGTTADITQLEALATLSSEEYSTIQHLEKEIADLKAQDIPKRAVSLRQDAKDLRALLTSLVANERLLGRTAAVEVAELITHLENARHNAETSGATQFQTSFFTEVGTEVWREFVVAAKSLADAESRRGTPYPTENDKCLLCRQPLPSEAVNLIQKLWDFLKSHSAARFEQAQQALLTKIRELERVDVAYLSQDSSVRRLLAGLAPEIESIVQGQVAAYSARKSELIAALKKGRIESTTESLLTDPQQIETLIESRETAANTLEREDMSQKLAALESALRELQHRKLLISQLPAIKEYVKTKRWVARGRQALGSTRNITTKHNELFQELVTDRFIKLFQDNLARLNANLQISVETRGQKGETVRQIVLNRHAFPGGYPIEDILSEGEKRAVALADFLTEASLDECCTGIVLDDPISSFDLHARKSIARHLAELARTRQVTVFTHDLAFLYDLKACARELSVAAITHWIQRAWDGTPGIVFLNNSPVCERDYKSAQLARERYSKAKSAAPQEQQMLLTQGFGALRTSYEAFVIFELFEGVVERFEERISFGRLADVSLDREIVEEVIRKMEAISRHIDAHLHSDSFAGEKPGPQLLLAEIESFENLRKTLKQKKKTAQKVVSDSAVRVEPAQAKTESTAAASPESIDLERRARLANQLRPRN